MIPDTYFESISWNAGANLLSVTLDVALPLAVVATTDTVPVAVSSGACKLICPGLTNKRNAALPLISTLVPPSDVGKSPLQLAGALARLLPKIETSSPGWITLAVLSRGTMPPGAIVGASWLERA